MVDEGASALSSTSARSCHTSQALNFRHLRFLRPVVPLVHLRGWRGCRLLYGIPPKAIVLTVEDAHSNFACHGALADTGVFINPAGVHQVHVCTIEAVHSLRRAPLWFPSRPFRSVPPGRRLRVPGTHAGAPSRRAPSPPMSARPYEKT